jgi:hypothetical protein
MIRALTEYKLFCQSGLAVCAPNDEPVEIDSEMIKERSLGNRVGAA